MPRVPLYNEQQVAARGIPSARQSTINLPADNGLANLGRGMMQAAGEFERIKQHDDELRAEEAVNQLRERQLDLTLGQGTGYVNTKGKNAIGIGTRYEGNFDAAANQIREGLANDRQRQVFDRYANRSRLEFKGGLLRHEASEADSWRKQTVQGVLAVEADVAAKNWNNDEAIDLSRARVDLNLSKMRDADGVPAEEMNRIRLGAMTKLHAGVLDAMIANKQFDRAQQHLQKFGDEIDAGVLLKATESVRKEQATVTAFAEARDAVAPAARTMHADDTQRLINITAQAESGSRDFNPDGSPVVSKTGVKWKMQVTDATARDPGYGVKPAQSQTPEEYNRVGEDLLLALVKHNGGNVGQAWAAYNGGQKYVDQAKAAATKNGTDWFTELRTVMSEAESRGEIGKGKTAETVGYVQRNVAAFQSGLGAPKRETFADVDARLRTKLGDKPEIYKQAREFAKQEFDARELAVKREQEEAEGNVYRELEANGGDWLAVPANLRAAMDPTKRDTAMQFAARLKKGEETVTNPALYQELATNPQALKNLTDAEFYGLRKDLSLADFKHFANERAKVQGKSVTAADDLNSEAMNRTLNVRLQSLGIDPTPKDSDTAGMQRVGAVRQFVARSILDAQRQAGKKLTDAEVLQHIDGLFANSTQLKGFFGGISSIATLTMKPGDVPSEARDQIKKAFKAAQLPEPTATQILEVYWAKKFSPKSALQQAKAPSQADQIPK